MQVRRGVFWDGRSQRLVSFDLPCTSQAHLVLHIALLDTCTSANLGHEIAEGESECMPANAASLGIPFAFALRPH